MKDGKLTQSERAALVGAMIAGELGIVLGIATAEPLMAENVIERVAHDEHHRYRLTSKGRAMMSRAAASQRVRAAERAKATPMSEARRESNAPPSEPTTRPWPRGENGGHP